MLEKLQKPAWVAWSLKGLGLVGGNGDSLEPCAKALIGCPYVLAVGINCYAPEITDDGLQRIRDAGWKGEIVVYPNSGETWDAREGVRKWVGEKVLRLEVDGPKWVHT